MSQYLFSVILLNPKPIGHLIRRFPGTTTAALIAFFTFCLSACTGPIQQAADRADATGPQASAILINAYLIPVEPFPFEFADELARNLSRDLNLNIRASLPMGSRGLLAIPGSSQFAASDLIERTHAVALRLPSRSDRSIAVALTTLDINDPGQKLRFLFAGSDKSRRTSVISVARMSYSTSMTPVSREQFRLRVYKMTKRAIGELYFGMARSSSIDDIMYAPIMSLDDIDAMGMHFK